MMTLEQYIADDGRKRELTLALDTSEGYLWQIATRWRGRRPSPKFALRIEAATRGAVPKWELRPDIWTAPESEETND